MAHDSLAGRVRKAARELKEFRVRDLADAVGVQTYKGLTGVRCSLGDFLKRGEMERVSRGLYRYVEMDRPRTKLDVIWHLARSHKHFGLDEMERLSGAKGARLSRTNKSNACCTSIGVRTRSMMSAAKPFPGFPSPMC